MMNITSREKIVLKRVIKKLNPKNKIMLKFIRMVVNQFKIPKVHQQEIRRKMNLKSVLFIMKLE